MKKGIDFIKRRIEHLYERIDSQENLVKERKDELDREIVYLSEFKEERDGLLSVLESIKD